MREQDNGSFRRECPKTLIEKRSVPVLVAVRHVGGVGPGEGTRRIHVSGSGMSIASGRGSCQRVAEDISECFAE